MNQTSADIDKRFQCLIQKVCGLYFKDSELDTLFSAIDRRMTLLGLTSMPSYYDKIANHKDSDTELKELLELLTIRHTYFFRNRSHFEALKQVVLPEIIKKKTVNTSVRPSLTVWSAGCSTGQEPYSIAMTIAEVIGDASNWDIHVLGTDVSKSALQLASQGFYPERAMKYVNATMRQKYFNAGDALVGHEKQYQVKDQIRAWVDFDFFNLQTGTFPFGVDIVFCRNVVIYFDQDTVNTVMINLDHSLAEDGYLFIGHSESLPSDGCALTMRLFQDGVFYQKSNGVETHSWPVENDLEYSKCLAGGQSVTGVLRQRSEEVCSTQTLLSDVETAVVSKSYMLARKLIDQIRDRKVDDAKVSYWEAQLFIHEGKLLEARQCLGAIVEDDCAFAPAYYLLGTICQYEQKIQEAMTFFKRALYVDKQFVLARYSLATILKNNGQSKEAHREYQNVIKQVSSGQLDLDVKYGDGVSYAMLVSMCKKQCDQLRD